MGIRLVGEALNPSWSQLSDRARLVLLHMAYSAKDTSSNGHAAGTYWAGHATLIVSVLGLDPDELDRLKLENAEKMIQRAVRELRLAGAISTIATGSRGSNAVYQLHPDRYPGLTLDDTEPTPEPVAETQPTPQHTTRTKVRNGHRHPVHNTPQPVDNSAAADQIVEEWGTPRVPH